MSVGYSDFPFQDTSQNPKREFVAIGARRRLRWCWCSGVGGVAAAEVSPLTMLAPHSLPRHSLRAHHRVATAAAPRWSRSSPPLPRTASSPHPLPPLQASSCLSLSSPPGSFPVPRLSSPWCPLAPLTHALSPPLINSSHMPSETHSEPIAATYHNSRPLLRPSRGTWPHPKSQSSTHAFKEAAACPGRLIPPS